MEYFMLIAIFASAAIGGFSGGAINGGGKRKSYGLLVALLISLVAFFIVMVSAVYMPRIILGC